MLDFSGRRPGTAAQHRLCRWLLKSSRGVQAPEFLQWRVRIRRNETLGWAAETLDRALWQSSALGLSAWQLMTGLLVAWRTPEYGTLLIPLHVGVALLGVVLTRSRSHPAPRVLFFSALFALLVAELSLARDPLAVTVLCMTFVVIATPFLVLRWGPASAVSFTAVSAAVGLSLFDGAGHRIALALSIPVTCYSLAAFSISTFLRRFADDVDRADDAATREHGKLVAERAAARAAAELSRTLHDTVINTLAAIATGGRAVADADRVRRRCAQDVASILSLSSTGGSAAEGIEDVGAGLSLAIEWTGVAASTREDWIAGLPAERRAALRGVIKELLLNVEKHAGTAQVTVQVQATGDAIEVTVVDHGAGFVVGSGGRGLTESVYRRAAEVGIDVQIASAPGHGTRATVVCPATDAGSERLPGMVNLEYGADRIRRTGTWVWCVGVCMASLISGAVGTPTPATFASNGLVASMSLLAWHACRHGRRLPTWLERLLIAAVPAAFALGFVGANFEGGDPIFWQAIGLTPLFVILLNMARSWLPLAIAAVALSAAAGLLAWRVWSFAPDAGAIALAHAGIELMQVCVWLIFVKILNDITVHSNASRFRALRDAADRAALAGASRVQERWRDAQVLKALELLREIADGKCSATDPDIQARAGKEEHSLRQLLLLSPELTYLGPWLARCLGQSRMNDVRLTIRAGDVDLPDDSTAGTIGRLLVDLLSTAKAGTELVFGSFPKNAVPAITVVGPSGFGHRAAVDRSSACTIRVTTLPSQDLMEIQPNAIPATCAASEGHKGRFNR